MQQTSACLHKTGVSRGFLLKDPAMSQMLSGGGQRTLRRMGAGPVSKGLGHKKVGDKYSNTQYQHAFPLLTHDDFGNSDQSNDLKRVMYSMYMPKRNKGTAPWFRGADTYSVKYSEQGRFEYQRYLMINRFPSAYKRHFTYFLSSIRAAGKGASDKSTIPQEALHWLMRMIVDNFNPQHVHYQAAMKVLLRSDEVDMAKDVWKIMERQQTWPCNGTISTFLDVCLQGKEKSWALEVWNRYCTELKFLEDGEADPKPISRTPFSLTREELLHLPKWKKHFDHDPNLDVIDLNRFNKTREIYSKMALILLAAGDEQGSRVFFEALEKAMLSTPTPVPEPPNPHLVYRPRWGPYESNRETHENGWRPENTKNQQVLGSGSAGAASQELDHRFLTNEQFLVYHARETIRVLNNLSSASPADKTRLVDATIERLFAVLGKCLHAFNTDGLLSELIQFHANVGRQTGAQLHTRANDFLKRKAALADNVKEITPAVVYRDILNGCAAEGAVDSTTGKRRPDFDPKATMATVASVTKEMLSNPDLTWTCDMHLAVVQAMVRCGTMKANEYFVNNVLRKFRWNSKFLEALYEEYRRHDDIDMWAELTKRALVWCARYDVPASEELRRAIEDDYDVIKVQTRTFRELAVFQFRDVEEKRHARNPVNELPNPWIDYVSHALPFPDRDTGHPDEYGDIGQWRAPGGPGSPTKGPGYYAPPMEGEHLKGYTAEWRDSKNPMKPPAFPNPWERKYKQYARGQHPSYDMVYAGPMPEIMPGRVDWRKPTRWDYHDVEKQGKFKCSGPW